MTSLRPKLAKFLAAPRLQHARVMPRVAALVALLAAAPAFAQTSNSTQMCTAGFTALLGVAFPKTPGGMDYQQVSATFLGNAFGAAECECATTDAVMQVQVTAPIPSSMQYGSVEYWVGSGCESYTTRTTANTTACENFGKTGVGLLLPQYQCYTSLSTGCETGIYRTVSIPAQPLFAPVTHQCGAVAAPTNDVYVVVYPQGQDVTMAAACKLNLTESMQTPPAPINISVGGGDSAVTLSWQQQIGTSGNALWSFQVLCADADGNPIPGKKPDAQAYSVCLGQTDADAGTVTGGVISRRNTIFQGSGITTGTDDGGTTTQDLSVASEPLLDTQAVPADGGADAGAMINNNVFADTSNNAIDPKYICTNEILASGQTSFSTRITGLNNNQFYQFLVLSIDQWGNTARSQVLVAEPTPTEDLWRRWYHDTGYSPGFCGVSDPLFIAGDALLVVLAIAFLASRRRRA
jgi:hypothetical protein